MRTKIPPAKKLKKYIQLQSPLTLDKYKDGTAQMRLANELQELSNYIPCDGYIFAREGIVPIVYTPETTTPPDEYFPETGGITITSGGTAEWCRCRMVLKFDLEHDICFNSVFGATLPNIGTGMSLPLYNQSVTNTWTSSEVPKQGTGSLFVSTADNTCIGTNWQPLGVTVRISRPTYGIDWFAGETTLTTFNRQMMVTYWFKQTGNFSYENGHIGIHPYLSPSTTPAFISRLYRSFSGAFSVRAYFEDSSGGTIIERFTTSGVETGHWYFVAAWAQITSDNSGIYVYRDSDGYEWTNADNLEAMTNSSVFSRTTGGYFTVGGEYQAWYALGGGNRLYNPGKDIRMDYVTYWDLIPSVASSTITLARLIRDLHKT